MYSSLLGSEHSRRIWRRADRRIDRHAQCASKHLVRHAWHVEQLAARSRSTVYRGRAGFRTFPDALAARPVVGGLTRFCDQLARPRRRHDARHLDIPRHQRDDVQTHHPRHAVVLGHIACRLIFRPLRRMAGEDRVEQLPLRAGEPPRPLRPPGDRFPSFAIPNRDRLT
jgi:hypothetical protein